MPRKPASSAREEAPTVVRRRPQNNEEKLARTFCALTLSDDAREAVVRGLEPIRATLDRANWVHPARWHITVKFFGEIPESGLETLGNTLQMACGERLSVQLRGAGAFPDLREPQVLWVGVRDAGRGLEGLFRTINDACAPLGYAPENRKFRPHLTVARLRPTKAFPVARELTPVLDTLFIETELTELVLYRSDMGPDGAVYTPLRRMALSVPRKKRTLQEPADEPGEIPRPGT